MSRTRAICFTVTVIGIFTMLLLGRPFSSITPKVDAQAQSQLVPLVTDQTPLALSNQFGAAQNSAVNQNGDYAFIGNGGSALYYRSAGSATAATVLLMGDEVPGYPGSRNDILNQIRMNSSGLLAFRPDFFLSSGLGSGAIFTFNGTTLQQVVSGSDLAPGGGGATFGRAMNLVGLNDAGDISFTAPLIPPGSPLAAQTTLYIKPAGATPVRVAGLGDVAPGTGGGTYSTLNNNNLLGFNNRGEELFTSLIVGGSGGTVLFVGDVTGVRKVVAPGDPIPGGGTFTAIGTPFINNSGQVAFQANGAIFIDTPGVGISRLLTSGDPLPSPVDGTIAGGSMQTFGDGGDAVLVTNVSGSPIGATVALFRKRAGNPIELCAYRNEAVPGAPGETFSTSFTGVSTNASGTVSFRATLVGGSVLNGVFQQTGTNAPVNIALDGQAAPVSGGGTHTLAISSPTLTLNNDSTFFRSDIQGGTADYAELLNSGGATTVLMNTGDTLPAASRVMLRTFRVGGSGDSVGFLAQRTGGRFSIVVHSIANQATNLLVTDGDVAPGTSGGLIRLVSRNTVFQNTGGTTVFTAQIIGGSLTSNTGLFVRSPGGSLTKIAANGDVDPLSGKTFAAISVNAVTPLPLNDAGQVVFFTTLVPVSGPSTRAIYRWSPGSGMAKIAAVNDVTSTGGVINTFPNPNLSINSSGEVAFIATTLPGGAGVPGIFVGSGGTPGKVVSAGDAGPSGSTFFSFAAPGFNDSGEVAFIALLTGGPGSGAFVGSTSGAPVAVALSGAAAPGGGTFSLTAVTTPTPAVRPDIVINNQHDIALRSNLTGGTSDSGYFVRRGAGGTLQAVALQGQSAPGTTGVFESIVPGINNLVSENFQLGPDGDLAFENFFIAGGQRTFGFWHVRPTDNGIEEILVRGTVAPEFGGGSATVSTVSTAWNSGGRFAVWARISGGTFTDGIFLFVPTVSTNTPAGTVVPVTVIDSTTGTSPVAMTFDSVTQAGETSLTTSSGGPAIPTAFALGDPPVFYNLETTATFSGSISVCIDFSNVSFPPGSTLRLLHFEGGVWVDVTTSGPTGNVICGGVTSLSPFTVVQVLNAPPVANAGPDQTTSCGSTPAASITLDGSGSSDPDLDTLSFEWRDEDNNIVGTSAVVNLSVAVGFHTYTLTVNDGHGFTSNDSVNVTVNARVLTAIGPANVWIGLKNSDDVGTRFDLLVEVFKDGNPVGSGQLNSVPGGSSGFNNAKLNTIPLTLDSSATCCGGTLSARLSVRVAATGHRSGTARLWFNDAQANSRFGATIGGSTDNYFLLDLFNLGTAAGPGPKKTIDVLVDRAKNGNPFKPFGTWTITLP